MRKTCSPELPNNQTPQTIGPKLQEDVAVSKSVESDESAVAVNDETIVQIEIPEKVLPAVSTKCDIDFSEDVGIEMIKTDVIQTDFKKLEVNGDISESDVGDIITESDPEKCEINDAEFLQVGTK